MIPSTLGQAVVPLCRVCRVLIGMSLAHDGIRGTARAAVRRSTLKLIVLAARVPDVARWRFQLHGLPLTVSVMMAALPVGNAALTFAQRDRTPQAQTTTATVPSTLAWAALAALWLTVPAWLACLG